MESRTASRICGWRPMVAMRTLTPMASPAKTENSPV